MVVKEVVLIGGLGLTAWILLSAFSNRIPNPVEAVEDLGEGLNKAGENVGNALTAKNDQVTGETPEVKGFFRNTEDFLYGDGSSAARIARTEEVQDAVRERGIVASGFDTLFGNGAFAAFNNRQSANLRNFFGLQPYMPPTPAQVAVTTSKNPSGVRTVG